MMLATDGRFFTLDGSKLPGGRGNGEAIRSFIDLPPEADIVTMFVHVPGRKLLVAATSGHGFITNEDDAVAMTKNGKRVMNVKPGVEAVSCRPVDGDTVAVVGENRKLLIFKLDEVPELGRGQGVYLQRYKDGGLIDAATFTWKAGLKDENGRLFEAVGTQGLEGRARPGRPHRAARLGQVRKVRREYRHADYQVIVFRNGTGASCLRYSRARGPPVVMSALRSGSCPSLASFCLVADLGVTCLAPAPSTRRIARYDCRRRQHRRSCPYLEPRSAAGRCAAGASIRCLSRVAWPSRLPKRHLPRCRRPRERCAAACCRPASQSAAV